MSSSQPLYFPVAARTIHGKAPLSFEGGHLNSANHGRTLNVAFWNVCNLFEPGIVERGPKTEQELEAKIATTARVINRFFAGTGPHLLGLPEIQSEQLLARVRQQLQGDYVYLWAPSHMPTNSGLGLLARTDEISAIEVLDVCSPVELARPRIMIAQCSIRHHDETILIIVNHWKSNVRHSNNILSPESDRMETARWLGDWLGRQLRSTCVVAMGDFNAEPFEPPFSEMGLRSVRFFSTALWSNATAAYLYNTAWRHLPEPELWESVETGEEGRPPLRPTTSFDSSPPKLYDQVLVSGRALRSGPITLLESSVSYYVDQDTCSKNLKPLRWDYQDGKGTGVSDHFPILSTFRINGGKQ